MVKRLTNEVFLSRVKSDSITVVDSYVDSATKLKCVCKKCGYVWHAKPSHLMDGHGCSNCLCMVKITEEKFVELLSNALPKARLISQYAGRRTNVTIRCEHGHEWSVLPNTALKGNGCHVCNNYRQMDNEAYQEYMKSNHKTIQVRGVYTGSYNKVELFCKVCGHLWKTAPSNSLSGHGCPKCAGTKKKTQDEFENDVLAANPQFTIVGDYVNHDTRVETKCNCCGAVDYISPYKLTSGKCLCKWCSKTSYGYRKHVHAYLYIYTFSDYVGFGITNNIKIRNVQHRRQFDKFGVTASLVQVFEGYGDIVFETELKLKQKFVGCSSTIPGFVAESADISELCNVLNFASNHLKVCKNFENLL